jgi:hypothetical protein
MNFLIIIFQNLNANFITSSYIFALNSYNFLGGSKSFHSTKFIHLINIKIKEYDI